MGNLPKRSFFLNLPCGWLLHCHRAFLELRIVWGQILFLRVLAIVAESSNSTPIRAGMPTLDLSTTSSGTHTPSHSAPEDAHIPCCRSAAALGSVQTGGVWSA